LLNAQRSTLEDKKQKRLIVSPTSLFSISYLSDIKKQELLLTI